MITIMRHVLLASLALIVLLTSPAPGEHTDDPGGHASAEIVAARAGVARLTNDFGSASSTFSCAVLAMTSTGGREHFDVEVQTGSGWRPACAIRIPPLTPRPLLIG